ncbi:MAG TPA: hypothetical protein VHB25_04260, partial [Gemmatimonadaceae bacterium]|nr:hypothetical protein [Gemmatimonadaceae bacterium]
RALAAAEYDRERLAEVLNNVAQVLHDMGRHATALRGFGAVVNRTRSPRLVLAALGGAALAAAALGATEIVAAAGDRIVRLGPVEWPYPHAVALLDLADAYAALGERARADTFRAHAHSLAEANGFHELAYRAERAPARPEPRAADGPLGPSAVELVSKVESLDAPRDLCMAGGRGVDQ